MIVVLSLKSIMGARLLTSFAARSLHVRLVAITSAGLARNRGPLCCLCSHA